MGEGGGFFARLRAGLGRTRQTLVERVEELVTGRKAFDEEFFEELEALLLQADVGVTTTVKILSKLRERIRTDRLEEAGQVRGALQAIVSAILAGHMAPLKTVSDGPMVVMVVGVNGTGKTTTVGKLAKVLRDEGKSVLMGAADTFRAAAAEQLAVWADRTQAGLVHHHAGSDPAAVAFDAARAAVARKVDYLLVDTAGRLHTKDNLMAELEKVGRVLGREIPGAPHEVLLVLDATTGQNAIQQAKVFGEAVNLTGLVLTKLDGTAKGGVVIAIADTLGVPVKYIGVGEQAEDLRPFDPRQFAEALFGADEPGNA